MNKTQFSSWLQQRSQTVNAIISEKPLIMGVLNVTEDSFSDGGAYLSLDKACEQASKLISQGADIIDIGGESSRPNADPIPIELELKRVIPLIEQIRHQSDICISIDTYKPEVMQAAVQAGADIINDIYALRQPGSLEMAAKLAVPVCLMHMQGNPKTMQEHPHYTEGIMHEILGFFSERIEQSLEAGIAKNNLILDPGFGFGKQVCDNLSMVYHIQELNRFKLPTLLGVSRKSTLGVLLDKPVNERLIGGIAFAVYAALQGVGIIRTHDVDETNQALTIIHALHQVNK